MARLKTNKRAAATADDRTPKPLAPSASVTAAEIASRAYDLYLARGCEHGHDVEDWLRAERELNAAPHAVAWR
jgi:hypothetical protein